MHVSKTGWLNPSILEFLQENPNLLLIPQSLDLKLVVAKLRSCHKVDIQVLWIAAAWPTAPPVMTRGVLGDLTKENGSIDGVCRLVVVVSVHIPLRLVVRRGNVTLGRRQWLLSLDKWSQGWVFLLTVFVIAVILLVSIRAVILFLLLVKVSVEKVQSLYRKVVQIRIWPHRASILATFILLLYREIAIILIQFFLSTLTLVFGWALTVRVPDIWDRLWRHYLRVRVKYFIQFEHTAALIVLTLTIGVW